MLRTEGAELSDWSIFELNYFSSNQNARLYYPGFKFDAAKVHMGSFLDVVCGLNYIL